MESNQKRWYISNGTCSWFRTLHVKCAIKKDKESSWNETLWFENEKKANDFCLKLQKFLNKNYFYKAKIKISSLLLLFFITSPILAEDIPNNEIWYTSIDEQCLQPIGSSFNAAISSNTYKDGKGVIKFSAVVTNIKGQPFSDKVKLATISLPSSVTSIGFASFEGCSSLTYVQLGDSISSIGSYAFQYCFALKSIKIPESLTTIEHHAFAHSGLVSISLPNKLTTIEEAVFEGDTCLQFIYGGASVNCIKGWAFNDCPKLLHIDISNNISKIDHDAFSGCCMLSLIIPSTIVEISDGAFTNVFNIVYAGKLKSTNWGEQHINGYQDGCILYADSTRRSIIDCLPIIEGDIIIPYSVLRIEDRAFEGCINISSIVFSDSINYIGDYSFDNCCKIKSIKFIGNTNVILGYGWNLNTNILHYIVPCGSAVYFRSCPNGFIPTETYGDFPYDIKIQSDTCGSAIITSYPDCLYQQATIQAIAKYGYKFHSWNDNNKSNPRIVEISSDTTLISTFTKRDFKVIGQSINGEILGIGTYLYQDTCIIKALNNYGYHFDSWSDGNTENPRVIVVTQDTTFEAIFNKDTFTITTIANYSERGITDGDTSALYLEQVLISATPNYGYHFTLWNDGNNNNPRQVLVTGDKTYTAHFDKNVYYIQKIANSTFGQVSGCSSASYLEEVTVLAAANYGYHFTQWADGNTDNPRTVVLTQDTTFEALFAMNYSGQCGDNLFWQYNNGKLTISGSGAMYNEMPWLLFADSINQVIFPTELTTIGDGTFKDVVCLNSIIIPAAVTKIGANAFAGCRKLLNIYCYSIEPPYSQTSSFENYNVYLRVPCDRLLDYQLDAVFGSFKYIECIGAEPSTNPVTDVTVIPSDNTVTITWPADANAGSYTIEIKKDGITFCTLTFNAEGQLTNIAFAPGRGGSNSVNATVVAGGYKFTITSLTPGTKYNYEIDTQNASGTSLANYTGSFTTTGTTALEAISFPSWKNQGEATKVIKDGKLYILRDGKTYNAQGAEVK